MNKKTLIKPIATALLAAALSACSNQAPAPAKAASLDNEDWYQIRSEKELFLFDDYAAYRDFANSGEAAAKVSTGKQDGFGRDIVLVPKSGDQGKDVNTLSVKRFLDVSLPPAQPFYGELRDEEGIIYVFSRYGDMMDMYKIGEPTFSYVDIGGGPNGERVVYVLAKEEPKPEKQIALFRSKYGK
ncbi:hypothetical protein [Metapseudomonas boanensis]|uniref:Lipoprotein n=1 Tax=Metapseudomonas boanensis TaxID=2822138 RepID=A0ABS5XPA1_9GAMM|nr:hypothetical protein [Pseudomonas boanensis]MBT8769527.1 hypothetical protein [Pseudomonas boanensis]